MNTSFPLVFLHGLLTDHSVWNATLKRQGDLENAVALDLIGHGKRAGDPEPHNIGAAAHRLGQDLAAMSVTRPILIGWSFGGSVAMRYAADGADIAGLVLIGATPQFIRDDVFRFAMPAAAARMRDHSLEQDYEATTLGFGAQVTNQDPKMAKVIAQLAQKVPKATAQELFKRTWTDTLLNDLSRITMPVEVIHGARDQIVPLEAANFLSQTFPNCGPVRCIENGSHAPFLTQQDAFDQHLSAALASISSWLETKCV